MQNKANKSAVISGVLGVLAFIILILDWGATPPQPTLWYFFFLISAAGMAVAGIAMANKAEKASVEAGKTGEAADILRFWTRLGRVGGVIVIMWLGLLVIGFVITAITG